ncbi:uncharacterized protein E0L32_008286 [Thyridium curvatum]|uniref:Uncharacterized protein n=1 Tax=Thyridium curvatum TaxID=1093900 RepID=A0A507ATC8_9PEZI|nr:uncharacterized protein E0L32_008286 [Thyridium curvatum]TPX10717.1 hypothetical protein E0L32_008286 [Thyridium curvatum]
MSTQQIKAKAFRVTQGLSELEVRTWREQGVTLTPLHVGDFGWIPLEPNLDENGNLRAVVAIQRAAYSNTGTGMVTPEDGGYTLATRIPSRAVLQTASYQPDGGPSDTVVTAYLMKWLRTLTEQ